MTDGDEVLTKLTRIEIKLDHAISGVADHEGRIRTLERGRWPLPSLAALVSLAALILTLITMARGG